MTESELKSLLICGLGGDNSAYDSFLHEISAHLRAFFRARTRGDRPLSEDLVQEVLIAIHTKRHTFDPQQPVTAWVYAIARYKLIDHWRRLGRQPQSVPLDDAEGLLASVDSDTATAAMDLNRLLKGLSNKQRQAIQLVKIEGLSVQEAAQTIATSESDIKVSIHRGVKKLLAFIRREDLGNEND